MKIPLAAAVIGAGLILSAGTADAGYYKRHGYYGHHGHSGHYRHYRHRGHRGHYRHRGHHNGALVAAGIIGGAVLLGTLLSAPRYHHHRPAPVYYAPPRAPVCEKDNVYRTLPDGRIQWGVRTRCY